MDAWAALVTVRKLAAGHSTPSCAPAAAASDAPRIKDPRQYESFARKNIAPGIDVIFGIKGKGSEIQAYRFDRKKFTPSQARAWLKAHDIKYISFEPASNEEINSSIRKAAGR